MTLLDNSFTCNCKPKYLLVTNNCAVMATNRKNTLN